MKNIRWVAPVPTLIRGVDGKKIPVKKGQVVEVSDDTFNTLRRIYKYSTEIVESPVSGRVTANVKPSQITKAKTSK